MLNLDAKFRKFKWIVYSVLVLLAIAVLYPMFFTQNTNQNTMSLLILGLLLGAVIMFLVLRLAKKSTQNVVKENSHTVVESIRKVFKIVFAEGQFSELYNYEETKKLFGFIPSRKRALVIIKAKVLVGYDFAKCSWEINEQTQTIRMISFPEPEILSIEPDYLYYDFDEGFLNLLGREDLTRIQVNGKKQVEMAAMNSHLPKIAADQMRTLLMEVVQSRNWRLEDSYKITEAETKNILAAPTT
jgi:hypothetical protein